MQLDELIEQLTDVRKELGNIEVIIRSEDTNTEGELSAVLTDSDIDCKPFVVLEYKL